VQSDVCEHTGGTHHSYDNIGETVQSNACHNDVQESYSSDPYWKCSAASLVAVLFLLSDC